MHPGRSRHTHVNKRKKKKKKRNLQIVVYKLPYKINITMHQLILFLLPFKMDQVLHKTLIYCIWLSIFKCHHRLLQAVEIVNRVNGVQQRLLCFASELYQIMSQSVRPK